MTALLDNQLNAISKLQKLKVGALFMEPGTGKTRSAFEIIKSIPGNPYILWLTPFLTKQNLQDEK
jgi:superfamily II DNA or RNA helicase